MSPSDLARHAIIVVIIGVAAIFGLKAWNKAKAKKSAIAELRSLTSHTVMFEQFSKEDSIETLLQAMHQLHDTERRFGIEPADSIDLAFQLKDESILDSTDSTYRRFDPRQNIIREALLRNHENASRLGFFEDPLSIEMLSRGEVPPISKGPSDGKTAEIAFIIDPAAFPGAERLIPNLVIRPPAKKDSTQNDFDITLAKRLAQSLESARLIEHKTCDRILDHYDNLNKVAEEEEKEEEENDPLKEIDALLNSDP